MRARDTHTDVSNTHAGRLDRMHFLLSLSVGARISTAKLLGRGRCYNFDGIKVEREREVEWKKIIAKRGDGPMRITRSGRFEMRKGGGKVEGCGIV